MIRITDKGWVKGVKREGDYVKIVRKSKREDGKRRKGQASVSTWDTRMREKNVVIFIPSHTPSTHQILVIFLPLLSKLSMVFFFI